MNQRVDAIGADAEILRDVRGGVALDDRPDQRDALALGERSHDAEPVEALDGVVRAWDRGPAGRTPDRRRPRCVRGRGTRRRPRRPRRRGCCGVRVCARCPRSRPGRTGWRRRGREPRTRGRTCVLPSRARGCRPPRAPPAREECGASALPRVWAGTRSARRASVPSCANCASWVGGDGRTRRREHARFCSVGGLGRFAWGGMRGVGVEPVTEVRDLTTPIGRADRERESTSRSVYQGFFGRGAIYCALQCQLRTDRSRPGGRRSTGCARPSACARLLDLSVRTTGVFSHGRLRPAASGTPTRPQASFLWALPLQRVAAYDFAPPRWG